jgi:hypothetical protein
MMLLTHWLNFILTVTMCTALLALHGLWKIGVATLCENVSSWCSGNVKVKTYFLGYGNGQEFL